jgi:glycosyltransferase involved in cell wall biosynthesis
VLAVAGPARRGTARAVHTDTPAPAGATSMRQLSVHHFGPDPAYVGGIGTVIRTLVEHQVGADRVSAHTTWRPDAHLASLPLALRAARRLACLPDGEIVHVHLSERGSFLREGALVALSRRLGRVTVVTIHGADFLPFADRRPWLAAAVLGRAEIVTCLAQDVLSLVREIAPRSHVAIVPNPVALDHTAQTAADTEEIVVFGGEISLRKGADVLARAWDLVHAARPDARCIVVGPPADFDMPERDRLEVRAPIDAFAMKALIRSARVVVLPSRAEGMPMILTEAMSERRPFVSTRVGGIPELAAGGILVAAGDHVDLANQVIAMLSDPLLAQEVGDHGWELCSQTRSTDVVGTRLRKLYQEALDA